jgi:hypothetical protein
MGIGIIGIPPVPVAPCAIAAGLAIAPNPEIAEVDMPLGIDPCHVGGTDIAPTNRA